VRRKGYDSESDITRSPLTALNLQKPPRKITSYSKREFIRTGHRSREANNYQPTLALLFPLPMYQPKIIRVFALIIIVLCHRSVGIKDDAGKREVFSFWGFVVDDFAVGRASLVPVWVSIRSRKMNTAKSWLRIYLIIASFVAFILRQRLSRISIVAVIYSTLGLH
jgi:hypothetical protein